MATTVWDVLKHKGGRRVITVVPDQIIASVVEQRDYRRTWLDARLAEWRCFLTADPSPNAAKLFQRCSHETIPRAHPNTKMAPTYGEPEQ